MFHLLQCEALKLHTIAMQQSRTVETKYKLLTVSPPMKRVRASEFIKFELNGISEWEWGKNNKNSS